MRYEGCTDAVSEVFEDVKRQHFPELRNVNVLILLDTKKCKSKGKLVLGKIKKASEVERYLTDDDVDEGYDFVMFLDKNMVTHGDEADLVRLIRRMLRHIFITDRGKLTLVDPDYTDFMAEVEINAADPNWYNRVSEMVSLIYEQEEDNN